MKHFLLCMLVGISIITAHAQTTATFESFNLGPGSFLNGSDGSGGFSDGNIFLPNTYDTNYASWLGWAISSTTDTLTAGFTNQYSAITGSGYNASGTYALTFAGPTSKLILTGDARGGTVEGLYVTNNTYAYYSILNGDSFTKKFGGETGDDPDFFLLTIKSFRNGELSSDSVDFYLADYRFPDNSEDYIVKEWSYIDLSTLGDADSLEFSLSSSDSGQYGINTPAYFCLDNVTTLDRPTPVREILPDAAVRIFPNPTTDRITVQWNENSPGELSIINELGQVLKRSPLMVGDNDFDLQNLPAGHYVLRIQTQHKWTSRPLILH